MGEIISISGPPKRPSLLGFLLRWPWWKVGIEHIPTGGEYFILVRAKDYSAAWDKALEEALRDENVNYVEKWEKI